ncbi:type IV toxin-antitoxin system AbiEi family antitoxin domain-containing protein [Nocardia salmonicida]|uniref:type IV toxin-antitoxin system AbiEi family antitoxin domain-containing protein n=1 Tax=Nocardia salmonicida TaxID=53431 RepID=UPI0007C85A8B|nr:type IV toxin-antitoxin system AbiEi family antitoxin domain-containing protein [Nocardia salmonicida]
MSSGVDLRARLAKLAESQWGLLTTAQAATIDIDTKQLQRLVDHAMLIRLRHGVYRLVGVPESPVESIRAEWLALEPARTVGDRLSDDVPIGVVSHRSAADLHGLGDLDADYLEFTVPTRRGSRNPDVRFHRTLLTAGEWSLVDGLPVTTPTRTIGDLAFARTDGGHLASVVRDALMQGASADEIVRKLRPYAHRYGAPVDNGSALLNYFITQAGVPESSLALTAPVLEPLLAANRAWNQALERILHEQGSAHLVAALSTPPPLPVPENALSAGHNQLDHPVPDEELTAAIHRAAAPLTETPQWREALAQIRTQILQSARPHAFSDTDAAAELASALLCEAVTVALIDTSTRPDRPASEVNR